MNRDTQISKFLSYVLRHRPDSIGLQLEENGWANVADILNHSHFPIDFAELKQVVENNEKRRFSFNPDFTKIKANQGHSVNVILTFQEVIPPAVLYHGTAKHFLESILKEGLRKGKRHHVHLSQTIQTASQVGRRHGELAVLAVDSKPMYEEGYTFYLSENQVYLVDYVPAKFLHQVL